MAENGMSSCRAAAKTIFAARVEIRKACSSLGRNKAKTEESEMKVMVLVKATKDSEQKVMPTQALLAEMGKFNEDLVKAGILLAGEGLRPSAEGKRVQFSGRNRTVIDGPFTETKELVAGFWLWQVRSIDEAIEWVKRCPNPMPGDSEIEIRQVFDMEDFAVSLAQEPQRRAGPA
jgi:hypothetical protein